MFKYNLLLIIRNIKRNKSSFFINLIGLSAGLACALLIYLWVNDELHVDKFHEKDGQIYQVMQNAGKADQITTIEPTPGNLAKSMDEEMPEVEYAVSVIPASWFDKKGILSVGDMNIKADGEFAGKDFFHIFSYKLIHGDENKVLTDKNAILLSDELALKIFHTTENLIGKTIGWNQEDFTGTYVVSGVFQKPPSNSTSQFDLLFNYGLFLEKYPKLQNWSNSDPSTYLCLKKGTNINQFNAKIANYLKSKDQNLNGELFVRPYSDKYLYGNYENGVQAGGRIAYVTLFSLIAIFILVIACINFMNLSTATAFRRSKEVGIKKAIGSNRKTLIAQYLGESMLVTFLSLIVAFFLVVLILPQFNAITGKNLSFAFNKNVFLSTLGIALFTGFVSGSYPAFYLSGFNPITVLKGKLNTSPGEMWTRKGLVIFQFTLSVIFIVGLLVVSKQIEFTQTKNLGYKRDNVIYFSLEDKTIGSTENNVAGNYRAKRVEAFINGLKSIPGVVNASNFWQNIVAEHGSTSGVSWAGKSQDDKINFACLNVGYDFIETLDIKVREGRTFSKDFGTDNSAIIFNEAAIKNMGLTEPVGKTVKLWGKERNIIGITKNFNFESLHNEIQPLFLIFDSPLPHILVKISAPTQKSTINQIQKIYTEYNPGFPFEFKFLDDDYQALYESENKVAVLSKYFAGIAILISCLGLFGLAAFTVERRRKEIGVRKVFGSSQLSIFYLLAGDFSKQVLVSILIATPLSFLIARHWLNTFAYKISLEWWFFVGAGSLALFIAWLTVGSQAVKAANTNPAASLKDE